jgi:hypothetical protein
MNSYAPPPHFHIRWDGKTLDWECFSSREEATARASFLKRDGETFAVEELALAKCPFRAKFAAQA